MPCASVLSLEQSKYRPLIAMFKTQAYLVGVNVAAAAAAAAAAAHGATASAQGAANAASHALGLTATRHRCRLESNGQDRRGCKKTSRLELPAENRAPLLQLRSLCRACALRAHL